MKNLNITNPYLIEYCRIHGIEEGEEIGVVEYSFWVETQHRRFQMEKFGRETFLTDQAYHEEFMEWLRKGR